MSDMEVTLSEPISSVTDRLAIFVAHRIREDIEHPLEVEFVGPKPTANVLAQLFGILFFASLKTEEGRSIQARVFYIDPDNPDPLPPRRVRIDRWRTFNFDKKLELNTANLAKFAKAADPWSTGIAVYSEPDGTLFVWGLVDQVLHLSTSVVRETEGTYPQPGAFHAVINGPADISVMKNTHFIARLIQDTLLTEQNDCLEEGPINGMISRWVEPVMSAAYEEAEKVIELERDEFWKGIGVSRWIRTVSRILIHIQRERHGGALLVTDYPLSDLRVKHRLDYPRLREGLQRALYYGLLLEDVNIRVSDTDFEKDTDISMELYLDEAVYTSEAEDVSKMTAGAVRLVSSLAGIDGLVILRPDLTVSGFGAIINDEFEGEHVLLSTSAQPFATERVRCDRFGMRHRSMMAYCQRHPGSVGFVVSQDGDVRVLTALEAGCVVFSNVKIQDLRMPKTQTAGRISSMLAARTED